MPRSMWKGAISFGMVSIPVRLFVATESHSASFRQLCAEHLSPIRYKRWCEQGEHELAYGDIRKGFEIGRDRFVVIEDGDLENLPLPTAHAIEISEFVPDDGLQGGLYYKSAYYVEPEDMGRKPYQLLRQALDETGMLALAKVAFRDREHLCSLQPLDGLLLLNTLHWPDEIRSTSELRGSDEDATISDRELAMAKSLVESLAEDSFDPSRYEDDYHRALMQVIDAKASGEEIVEAPEPEEGTKVMDLMDALKASVDAARKQRGQEREQDRELEQRTETEDQKKQPARRQARKKAS